MSWFSLSIQVKQAWDSHHKLVGLLTGGYWGNLIVEKGLKQCPTYLRTRDAIVLAAANRWTPRSETMNRAVSDKILEKVLNKKQVDRLGTALRKKVLQISSDDLYRFSSVSFSMLKNATRDFFFSSRKKDVPAEKTTSIHRTKDLITYLYRNFSMKRSIELITMLKDNKLTEFSHSILTTSLHPVCENAVQSGLSTITKVGLTHTADLGAKMIASFIVQSLIYKPIISSILKVMNVSNSDLHISTLPLISAACHTSYIGLYILCTKLIRERGKDADKKVLLQMSLKFAKEPINRALKSNSMFKYLEGAIEAKTSDIFTHKILQEVVDFYWTDLNKKKMLGLPLVN